MCLPSRLPFSPLSNIYVARLNRDRTEFGDGFYCRTGWTRWTVSGRQASQSVLAGIIGMGEANMDRVGLLHQLATLPEHPESVPINALVAVKGTPLQVWL